MSHPIPTVTSGAALRSCCGNFLKQSWFYVKHAHIRAPLMGLVATRALGLDGGFRTWAYFGAISGLTHVGMEKLDGPIKDCISERTSSLGIIAVAGKIIQIAAEMLAPFVLANLIATYTMRISSIAFMPSMAVSGISITIYYLVAAIIQRAKSS